MKLSKWVVLVLVLVPMMSIVCSLASVEYQDTDAIVLAAYQVWHGLPSHRCPFSGEPLLPNERAYDSSSRDVISRHIKEAKERGISAFVVDWYGPAVAGVGNYEDREFQDQATALLFEKAKEENFHVALMYDDQTVKYAESDPAMYASRVMSDLEYAERYLKSTVYLKIRECPALFIFPDDEVKPYLSWPDIRDHLSFPITLIDRDPNPDESEYDEAFDGFYAWVTATRGEWHPEGLEWGREYLDWFYRTMQSTTYEDKVAIGGVWPGFDDLLANWSENRFMSRFQPDGTTTYEKTFALAKNYKVEYIMLETWNDFEEGTDLEYGERSLVDMEKPDPEVLIRSTPVKVSWTSNNDEDELQVYMDHVLIYRGKHFPGIVYLSLTPGNMYELKVWKGLPEPLVKWVKIRRIDSIPGVEPVEAEPEIITVTSPKSGDSWEVDSYQTITWTSTGTDENVKIQFSRDNGCNWSTITPSTENDGSFPWTVPDMVSNKCLIRVSETYGDPSSGTSAMFSIVLPGYTLSVQSSHGQGAAITVSPSDINESGDGFTHFERIFYKGTVVTLTAPPTHHKNGKIFSHWKIDGKSQVSTLYVQVCMDSNHKVKAYYREAKSKK